MIEVSLALPWLLLGIVAAFFYQLREARLDLQKKNEELTATLKQINEVHNGLTIQFQDVQTKLSAFEMMLKGKK